MCLRSEDVLIHAKDTVSVTLDDKFLKLLDLSVTPQHGTKLQTKFSNIAGRLGTPSVYADERYKENGWRLDRKITY